jgi:hypothetical protein
MLFLFPELSGFFRQQTQRAELSCVLFVFQEDHDLKDKRGQRPAKPYDYADALYIFIIVRQEFVVYRAGVVKRVQEDRNQQREEIFFGRRALVRDFLVLCQAKVIGHNESEYKMSGDKIQPKQKRDQIRTVQEFFGKRESKAYGRSYQHIFVYVPHGAPEDFEGRYDHEEFCEFFRQTGE